MGTAEVEASTVAGKRCLQPQPVTHWATQDGLQGITDALIELLDSVTDVQKGASAEEKRNLRKSQTLAESHPCPAEPPERATLSLPGI